MCPLLNTCHHLTGSSALDLNQVLKYISHMFDIFFPKKIAHTKSSILLIFKIQNFSFLKTSSLVTLLTIDKFKLKNYDIKLKIKRGSSHVRVYGETCFY